MTDNEFLHVVIMIVYAYTLFCFNKCISLGTFHFCELMSTSESKVGINLLQSSCKTFSACCTYVAMYMYIELVQSSEKLIALIVGSHVHANSFKYSYCVV